MTDDATFIKDLFRNPPDPAAWPHRAEVDLRSQRDADAVRSWCRESWGDPDRTNPAARWCSTLLSRPVTVRYLLTVWFRNPGDHALFTLTWC